jgi:hypothetical protein
MQSGVPVMQSDRERLGSAVGAHGDAARQVRPFTTGDRRATGGDDSRTGKTEQATGHGRDAARHAASLLPTNRT